MAIAAATSCSCLPLLTSHGSSSRYPLTSQSLLATSLRPSLPKEIMTLKIVKKIEEESPLANADGWGGRRKKGRCKSTAFKSFGVQTKANKEVLIDSKEQKDESGDLQDADFLNAVVKVYCTHTAPNYSLPWQKKRQYTSTGSAFMIGEGKLLTNAHCVEDATQVKVKRMGDNTKYLAKVLATGEECDIALLSVEDKKFWEGAEPLSLGPLPRLLDSVTVAGYPLGGDTISVTKGVVSRIENGTIWLRSGSFNTTVSMFIGSAAQALMQQGMQDIPRTVTSYAHRSSDLLSIQIDAAIKPGNSGGPVFNEQGECMGMAFQGVLVRKVKPTSDATNVLKEGDVILSFDGLQVGWDGTVPFRSNEHIAFRYLISQKYACDVAELGILRAGAVMKVRVVLNPPVNLVPYHAEGDKPSYLIVAGLVFTPLSKPLIEEECEDDLGSRLLTKARYSMARFKGEQIVILLQVLADEVNSGCEDVSFKQVLKLNGTQIKNIHHMAHLVDFGMDKYLVFELEGDLLAVLEREAAKAASPGILKDYGVPSGQSSDLLAPYTDATGEHQPGSQHEFGNDESLFEV